MAFLRRRSGDLERLADEDLIPIAQAGDLAAFDLLFERHSSPAYSLAHRILGGGAADDAVQEAFISIWKSLERYDRSRGSVRTWILKIVQRRAIDQLRSATVHSRRRADADDDAVAGLPDKQLPTDLEAIRRGDRMLVQEALKELPTDQTKVLELAYFGGYSHGEIADLLELPVGTVKGRMRLGLEKMRSALDDTMVAEARQ